MNAAWLVYLASAIVIVWGAWHIVPTATVVRSFGRIPPDSERIIRMEWVAEGLAHACFGLLPLIVTLTAGLADPATTLVCRLNAAALLVFAVWTAIAGFRIGVLPFKLCPFVLATAAALLLAATLV